MNDVNGGFFMNSENVEKLLSELLDEVKLLTTEAKATALEKFSKDYLTSDLRIQMYATFDGQRTLQEISKDIGCKINTLQIFAQLLIDNDLVNYTTRGNARILSKSTSKIAIFYARKALEEKEV